MNRKDAWAANCDRLQAAATGSGANRAPARTKPRPARVSVGERWSPPRRPGRDPRPAAGGDVRIASQGAGRARRGHRRWLLAGALVVLCLAAATTLIAAGHRQTSGYHGDPFSGVRMFVDPHSPAAQAERSLERSDPAAATLLRKIASRPTGIWLGSWIPAARVAATVQTVMSEAATSGSVPLFVLYAFPYRGCGRDAGIGSRDAVAYEHWIGQVAVGIGTGRAVVILEPDALAQLFAQPGCLPVPEQRNGLALLRRAVDRLVSSPNTAVYLDAGHSRWRPAAVMARLLLAAGVPKARGFALNVSNFNPTAAEEWYGNKLSALVRHAHYVIDTSRNGMATAKTWCNPPGQALGAPPTARTGNRLVDAFLWIKPPWASDGRCNGGPPPGMFWLSYALSLAAKARW